MFKLPAAFARSYIVLCLAALGMPLLIVGQTGPSGILQARYSPLPLAAGVEGKLQITLAVKDGFKVAKRPAPRLQIDPTTHFEVVVGGFSESVPSKDAEYYGAFKPLDLKIVPAMTTKAGKYSLEGKLTYFYCSEQDKYCSRSVEALVIPVEVSEK